MSTTIVVPKDGPVIQSISVSCRFTDFMLFRVKTASLDFSQLNAEVLLQKASVLKIDGDILIRVGPMRMLPERVKAEVESFPTVISNYMRTQDITDESILPESARAAYRDLFSKQQLPIRRRRFTS